MEQFTTEEIRLARVLRSQGLSWEPAAGHYVYDETGFCPKPSPFQDRVYFILNYPYFMKAVGGVDRFREIMTWLPTWDDLREILRRLEVSDEAVATRLLETNAVALGRERTCLYEFVAESLSRQTVAE